MKYTYISIFDEDASGKIDYKELIIGLEVFKDSTIDEKMKGLHIYMMLL